MLIILRKSGKLNFKKWEISKMAGKHKQRTLQNGGNLKNGGKYKNGGKFECVDDDLWQAKEVPAAAAGHLAGVAAGEGRAGHPH